MSKTRRATQKQREEAQALRDKVDRESAFWGYKPSIDRLKAKVKTDSVYVKR